MDSFIFRMQCSKLFESFIARTIVNEDELCFSMRLLTQNIGDTASLIVEKEVATLLRCSMERRN